MPYIDVRERPAIDAWILETPDFTTPGQLAYALTKLWRFARGRFSRFGGFFSFALVFGVTLLALLEFFRRDVVPYEEQRRVINGEVD